MTALAYRDDRRVERLTGITVVTVSTERVRDFRALDASLPPSGDPIVDKIICARNSDVWDVADRAGWTVLDGGGLRRGIVHAVSSHLLLLAPTAVLLPFALEFLWDLRSYPFVAATCMDGPRVTHAGLHFAQRTLLPVAIAGDPIDDDRAFPAVLLGAWLVARPLWDLLGGFRPDVDDVGGAIDFGLRAADAGWRPVVAAQAHVAYAPPALPPADHFVTHWLASGRLAHLFGLVTGPERTSPPPSDAPVDGHDEHPA